MGLFARDENTNTEEHVSTELTDLEKRFSLGELSKEDYEKRKLELEAQLAFLSVKPVPKLDLEAKLADLTHLHDKHWIGDEEFDSQRAEILAQMEL